MSRGTHLSLSFLILLLALACASVASAQQRPLLTEDVDIIETGTVRIEAGIDFLQDAKFPLSGLTGDLTRVGVIGVNVGLAPNVEFQIDGTLQNYLSINSQRVPAPIALNFTPGTNSTNDFGDFTLSTKIKLRAETKRGPSLGFRFGVQLPNSNQRRGLGTNQTNAYGMILAGKKFGRDGRVNLFGNLGIGILSAPTIAFTQNDVVLYGFAGIIRLTKQFNFVGEINGRQSTRKGNAPLGTESESEARLGLQIKASGLKFDFAGIAGLSEFSPRSGVTFGVTYDTPSVFTPAK
jgi:opacity protein-like surface antigen